MKKHQELETIIMSLSSYAEVGSDRDISELAIVNKKIHAFTSNQLSLILNNLNNMIGGMYLYNKLLSYEQLALLL